MFLTSKISIILIISNLHSVSFKTDNRINFLNPEFYGKILDLELTIQVGRGKGLR